MGHTTLMHSTYLRPNVMYNTFRQAQQVNGTTF